LTNITNTIQDQVVLTMSRLKLKASNQQYFITIQFRIGTYYLIRSKTSLIYKCLRKKLNVTWNIPVRNWKDA